MIDKSKLLEVFIRSSKTLGLKLSPRFDLWWFWQRFCKVCPPDEPVCLFNTFPLKKKKKKKRHGLMKISVFIIQSRREHNLLPSALSCLWLLSWSPHWESGGYSRCSCLHGFYKLRDTERRVWAGEEDDQTGHGVCECARDAHAAQWIPCGRQCWPCLQKGSTEAS